MNKPLGKKNYGSIPHLSNSKLGEGDHFIGNGQERILTVARKPNRKTDEIFAFEKYDGSNVGICMVNGEIIPLTRSGFKAIDSPFSQHIAFHDWVMSERRIFEDMLREGERITGEWLHTVHSITYEIYGDPVVFFDIFDRNNNRLVYDRMI